MKRALKTKDRLSVIEAMDILTSLSEIDAKFSFSEGHFDARDLHPSRWLEEDGIEENEEMICEAFESIRHYLEQMHKKQLKQFSDPQIQKGIEAILTILTEAREKLVQFTGLFKRGITANNLSSVKEYKQLMDCIESRILPHLPKKKSFIHEEEEVLLDEQEQTLLGEELEEIKQDEQYDLFYIKKENGHPFYDQDCLRKLQLLYDFEKMGEDSNHLLKDLRIIEAKDFQKRAVAILVGVDSLAREFYKVVQKGKSSVWGSALSKALMSLMLAATPHSVPAHGEVARTSGDYFSDFHGYLREALTSSEYQMCAQEEKLTGSERKFALLTHKLCSFYFLSISLEKEMASFLKELINYKEMKAPTSEILEHEDRALREKLHRTPNGPIKKIVGAFLNGNFQEGWDPLAQGYVPTQVFSCIAKKKKVHILHMAAPVVQRKVHEARVVKEFATFIDECVHAENKKMLIVDLQDITSFTEHARVSALQGLLENRRAYISILRLAKQTDFYFQKNEYQGLSKAKDFLEAFKEQILIGGACGFAFPKSWNQKETINFIDTGCTFIHEIFFGNKKDLSSSERQGFIEIFYAFLTLKTIDLESPDYVAFVSKDGLDSAVCFGSEMFFAMKMFFCKHNLEQKDQDFIFWWLYAPVLMLRERITHKVEADRVLHFMHRIEKGIKEVGKEWDKRFSALFAKDFIHDLEINSN